MADPFDFDPDETATTVESERRFKQSTAETVAMEVGFCDIRRQWFATCTVKDDQGRRAEDAVRYYRGSFVGLDGHLPARVHTWRTGAGVRMPRELEDAAETLRDAAQLLGVAP